MANISIWPGSSSFTQASASYYNIPSTGSSPTPFGFYDNDADFKVDANRVANFCALRLGYPIENVELQDLNFWTAFEQAITVYGNELYAYKLRDNYLSLEGALTSSILNNAVITPNMANIIRVSTQYGTEAGTGGNLTWYSGSIILTGSVQDYDLNQWAIENNISSSNLEIKRIYYEGLPATSTYYYGGGLGLGLGPGGYMSSLGGVPGYSGYGYYNYMVTPLSFNMGSIQQVELGQDFFMSAYSFELHNNKLRIYPVPMDGDTGTRYWFQYILKNERLSNSISNEGVSNLSNAKFNNPIYSQINSIGRSWIFEYTLALSKEMLGYVRNKYSQIPIPGAEVTLNGDSLLTSATETKNALIERLRAYFDETSREKLLERRKNESEYTQLELNKVPMTIYIG